MPCPTCIRALEQGAYAVYELMTFRPELLLRIPAEGLQTPAAVGRWLVETAGRVAEESPATSPLSIRPTP